MISTYKHNTVTWIDLQNPTAQELSHIEAEYSIPKLISKDLVSKTLRGKADFYLKEKIIYLVLHFPTIMQRGDTNHNDIEVDFVLGRDFIITTRYEDIVSIRKFAQSFDTTETLSYLDLGNHAGFFFFHLVRELYKSSLEQLEVIDREILTIEENIFAGTEESLVKKISELNRRVIDYRQALITHEETLHSFEKAGSTLFGDNFTYYLADILGEYRRVKNIVENQRETLRDLKDTNDAMLMNKTNTIMKALTIMSFIMLPLTLLSGIFGMNTGITLNVTDFYAILIIMLAMGITMFVFFRHKGWL